MNILDNGLDSLRKSVTLAKDLASSRGTDQYEFILKDIIIGLHHSTEVLFKYLIQKKNEYLIYQDLKSYFDNHVSIHVLGHKKKPKNNTIEFIDAINRVVALYDFKIEVNDYNKLKYLNDIRNSITHYEYEFKQDITEHLAAMLFPLLFKLYGKLIPSFNSFAELNGMYSDMKVVIDADISWNMSQLLQLHTNINNAKAEIKRLEVNPDEIKSIFESKASEIEYLECPCCKKNTFKVTGNILIDSENTINVGSCDYCKYEVNNQLAQFLHVNYNGVFSLENWIRMELTSILRQFYLTSNIEQVFDGEIESLKQLESQYTEIFESRSRTIVGYFVSDMFSKLLKMDFEKNYYFENDTMENLIDNNESKLYFDLDSLMDQYDDDDLFIESLTELKIIIENYGKLTGHSIQDSFDKLISIDFVEAYENGMYMSWSGQQIDSEITLRVDISKSELWDIVYGDDDEF